MKTPEQQVLDLTDSQVAHLKFDHEPVTVVRYNNELRIAAGKHNWLQMQKITKYGVLTTPAENEAKGSFGWGIKCVQYDGTEINEPKQGGIEDAWNTYLCFIGEGEHYDG